MTKFWELFERSVILQSIITLVLVGAVVYLFLAGREVPTELAQFTSLVIGFWFGSKIENRKITGYVTRRLDEVRKQ